MRNVLVAGLCLVIGLTVVDSASAARRRNSAKKAADAKPAAGKMLMLADFDSGTAPNNVGGNFGAWDKDPNDDTQSAKADFSAPGKDGKGQGMKIVYDVDSPNPAYNGFWMKLQDVDARPYKKLVFWVKGDQDAGFTKKFKVELKNASEVAPYYVTEITPEGNMVEIPFSSLSKITDWSKMSEFVIVFEDNQVDAKTGSITIDDVAFAE